MGIHVHKVGEGSYTATATPPHSGQSWSSPEPMTAQELVRVLRDLGCHTTDISDAFYVANPSWLQEVE